MTSKPRKEESDRVEAWWNLSVLCTNSDLSPRKAWQACKTVQNSLRPEFDTTLTYEPSLKQRVSVIPKSRIGNVALGKPQLWRTKGSSMPMHKALMRITIMVILKQGQLETAGSNHFNTRKHEKTGHWYSDILFPERLTLQNIYGQQCDRKQCLRTSSHPGAPIATTFRNAISTARSMQPVLPEIPRSRTMFQV